MKKLYCEIGLPEASQHAAEAERILKGFIDVGVTYRVLKPNGGNARSIRISGLASAEVSEAEGDALFSAVLRQLDSLGCELDEFPLQYTKPRS